MGGSALHRKRTLERATFVRRKGTQDVLQKSARNRRGWKRPRYARAVRGNIGGAHGRSWEWFRHGLNG